MDINNEENIKIIKELDDLELILDSIMDMSANERIAKMFNSYRSQQRNEKMKRKCSCPDCNNISILHSHTIPKSCSLINIHEDKKVLEPEHSVRTYIKDKMLIEMNLKGIETEATTFPGFCKKHEEFFSDFEISGKITNDVHYAKQCFRGLCKDIFLREVEKEHLEKELKEYKKERNKRVKEYLNKKECFSGSKKIDNITIEASDIYTRQICHLIEKMDSDISKLTPYRDKLYRISKNESSFGQEGLMYCTCPCSILLPVALSGYTFINLEGNDDSSLFYMNIVPLQDKTIIYCVIEKRDYNKLKPWFDRLENIFFLLSAVEEFMIYGTNEWCIKPSVWRAIPKSRQEYILSEICSNKSIKFSYIELSIFDEIRKTVIEAAQKVVSEDNIDENKKIELRKWIEFEEKKLKYNPCISLSEKEQKMQEELEKFFQHRKV